MSARVLLLNASFEPLTAVTERRAVCLILNERADMVEAGVGHFRGATVSVPRPAVIRLRTFVKVPYRRSVPLTRRNVLVRDAYRCAYCNKRASTIDHVHPRSKGGAHRWENVVASCEPCNARKDDRTPDQAGMPCGVRPHAPRGREALVVLLGTIECAWENWLN